MTKTAKILITLCVADLILILFGRMIKIGPIELRYILLATLLGYSFLRMLCGQKFKSNYLSFIAFYAIAIIISLILGLIRYPAADVFRHFQGNLYILMFIPFTLFITTKDDVKYILKVIRICSFILSLAIVFIFAVNFIPAAQTPLSTFLSSNELGFMGLAGSITRVFIRSIPFAACSLAMAVYEIFVYRKITLRIIVEIAIYAIACILCFTMGVWLGVVFGIGFVVFCAIRKRRKTKIKIKTSLFYWACFAALAFVPFVLQMFIARSTGTIDNSLDIKTEQLFYILNEWLKHPILGNGFGIERYFSEFDRTMITIELFWFDLLSTSGIIGLIACLLLCVMPILNSLKKYKKADSYSDFIFISLSAFIIIICVTTAFNPFLNASVGLIILSLAVCCINVIEQEMKQKIKNEEQTNERNYSDVELNL